MHAARNGSAVLAWDERGAGSPLLLVMGHRFSSAMWRWALEGLSREQRLLYFDNRGTGASNAPPGPYTIQDLAEDAFAVMDAAELSSAAVYGVSMGGMIAQQMALMRPERVRSLVLGCTAARFPGVRPPSAASYLRYWLPKSLALHFGRSLLYGSAATPERITDDLQLLREDRSDPRGLIGQAHAIAGFDVTSRLAEIRQPTLVIHGDEDKVIPLAMGQELASGIANSQIVVLKGSGHNYVADATESSTAAVLGFLKSNA